MRRVSGLDVHKDTVFLCIVDDDGVVFRSKYGVLTPELEQMAGVMVEYGVEEAAMESTISIGCRCGGFLNPTFHSGL